jgi:hypothetical protein
MPRNRGLKTGEDLDSGTAGVSPASLANSFSGFNIILTHRCGRDARGPSSVGVSTQASLDGMIEFESRNQLQNGSGVARDPVGDSAQIIKPFMITTFSIPRYRTGFCNYQRNS